MVVIRINDNTKEAVVLTMDAETITSALDAVRHDLMGLHDAVEAGEMTDKLRYLVAEPLTMVEADPVADGKREIRFQKD